MEQQFGNLPEKEERIKKLLGHCFEITKIEEGEKIPVGGESIFSTEMKYKMVADFESFKDFFNETHEAFTKFDLLKLRSLLDQQNIAIDEKLFGQLLAFTRKYEKDFGNASENVNERMNLYKNGEVALSDVFKNKAVQCAEIAALAQGYLQIEAIPSNYFGADVLWDKDSEDLYSEAHSYIVIHYGDKTYIYDPTNPTKSNVGTFPSIYTTEKNFEEEVGKGQKKFVTSKNIMNEQEVFYGVNTNSGLNVNQEDIV